MATGGLINTQGTIAKEKLVSSGFQKFQKLMLAWPFHFSVVDSNS
jgi:hypothetical protein